MVQTLKLSLLAAQTNLESHCQNNISRHFKLLDLENPLFGATFVTVQYMYLSINCVLANFLFEDHQLVTMVTMVGLR